MGNIDKEAIKFDCNRGCTISQDQETGEYDCNYRQGCCKLKDYDWLHGIRQEQFKDLFEVRFKNTRKGIYINASGQGIKAGDLVIVEATNGHDLGIVTLEGPVVGRQMKCKGVDPEAVPLKKIYRRAKPFDIAKWQEAIAREQDTMIQARRIAAELGLDMKIGDVEFQGDGTKAIFYYIADGRVDFRQLIKVYAEEFRIRIEMKQIGARQEAGLIGGLGVCGRELCCANFITNFQSISTSAARTQDLSLNPQKLAGQCGKLKCCLNYEVANYLDAQSRIPKVAEPLEFEDGPAYLIKTDILQEVMYFSYEKGSLANLYPVSASEVEQIIMMNRNGQKPESLKSEPEPTGPQFVSAVGDDSITRFDKPKKNKNKNRNKSKVKSKAVAASGIGSAEAQAKPVSDGSPVASRPEGSNSRNRGPRGNGNGRPQRPRVDRPRGDNQRGGSQRMDGPRETANVEAVRAWIETLSRNQRPMRNLLLALVLSLAVASCSRPSSYEPFVLREKAEYGDTYIFNLDLSDSTVSYGLDFYTRLERPAFGEFPADSISLDLRWISPSDSVILSDTTFIRVDAPVDSSYYSRDFVSGYKAALNLPEHGQWRLKAKVLNDSEAIRGLGVVFTRKENGTR